MFHEGITVSSFNVAKATFSQIATDVGSLARDADGAARHTGDGVMSHYLGAAREDAKGIHKLIQAALRRDAPDEAKNALREADKHVNAVFEAITVRRGHHHADATTMSIWQVANEFHQAYMWSHTATVQAMDAAGTVGTGASRTAHLSPLAPYDNPLGQSEHRIAVANGGGPAQGGYQ